MSLTFSFSFQIIFLSEKVSISSQYYLEIFQITMSYIVSYGYLPKFVLVITCLGV